MNKTGLSYKESGVDIDVADSAKKQMKKAIDCNDPRIINKLGAFASLFKFDFSKYNSPILVFKTEEPGTKQKLAVQHKSYRSVCYDTINHLVNDLICTGAKPIMAQDAIICGKLEPEVVNEFVSAFADACKEQDCFLTGGETSEQPGVVEEGTYILTTSMIGCVEEDEVIDGSGIAKGDVVVALEASGIHTNGLSLIRALIKKFPNILKDEVDGKTFLEQILIPHRCYYNNLKTEFPKKTIKGLAHVTGGGIVDNLKRIMPQTASAEVNLASIKLQPVFKFIQKRGDVSHSDMLRTYNLGVGMLAVVSSDYLEEFTENMINSGLLAYEIGKVRDRKEGEPVVTLGELQF